MKRYKRYFETCPGLKINEAVIIPVEYLKILQDIFITNKKNIILNSSNNNSFVAFLNSLYNMYNIFFIDSNITKKDYVCLKAKYEPDKNVIIIYMTSDSNFYLSVNFNLVWNSIKYMLGHELVHQVQYIRQKVKQDFVKYEETDLRKYYSDKKEIMSFAWQAIFLYLCFNRSKTEIIKALKNENEDINKYNVVVEQYYSLFEKDSKQLKLFLKYCYLYLGKML